MFSKVLIDEDLLKRPRLRMLHSAFWLVADEVEEVDFRETAGAEYEVKGSYFEAIIKTANSTALFDSLGAGHDIEMPYPDLDSRLLSIPHDAVILSNKPELKRMIIGYSGIDRQNIVLILAALGLQLPLTPVFFSDLNEEIAATLREALADEREDYLKAVGELSDGALERLKAQEMDDLLRWADDMVRSKILPRADAHARALAKYHGLRSGSDGGMRALDNVVPILTSLRKEGKEAASKAAGKLVEGKFREAAGEIAGGVVKALLGNRSLDPLICYGFRLKYRREFFNNEPGD